MSVTLDPEPATAEDTPAPGPVARALLGAVRLYQLARSGRPTGCRYLPTCSDYADQAIRRFGPVRGSRLALARLSRCRPWGGHGIDPVPDRSPTCRP